MQNASAGWTIGNARDVDNPEQQDNEDSESFYSILEQKIVPLFYERDGNDLPAGWIKMMKASISIVVPRFSTARMVRDYTEQAYLPAAKRGGAVSAPQEQTW